MRSLRFLFFSTFGCAVACGGSTVTPPVDGGVEATAPAKIPLAEQLTIDEVAAYQTLKLPWMTKGIPTAAGTTLPILRGKPALVRVFVQLGGKKKWTPRPLEAELHLAVADQDTVLTDQRTITYSSTEDALESTFDFTLDAAALGAATTVYVVVRDPAAKGDPSGELRAPKSGSVTPETAPLPGRLNVVVVPIRYTVNGANLLPDTGPADLAGLHDYLFDMYPVADVVLTLHAPLDFGTPLTADGSGWGSLLNRVLTLRANDQPEKDAYYVAAVTPTSSFDDYCPKGCIAGLAPGSGGSLSPSTRAVAVAGYSGDTFRSTTAHELGHAHGRAHAPCGGPAGVDPNFPYSGGASGVPGYRLSLATLQPDTVDVMSYCQPVWISDYTYGGLLTRVRAVAAQDVVGTLPEHDYRRYLVDPDGTARLGGHTRMTAPEGTPTSRLLTLGGATVSLTGHWVPFDHVDGGFFFVRE